MLAHARSLVNTLPPGYSIDWSTPGDYNTEALGSPDAYLTLTDLKGNEFKQTCYDGEHKGSWGEG